MTRAAAAAAGNREKMSLRLKQGFQDYFYVKVQPKMRLTDVYVVSVVPGRNAGNSAS